jgi:hypothetical protein
MKITLTQDDGTTVDFVVASAAPTEVVDVTAGESVEVTDTTAAPTEQTATV